MYFFKQGFYPSTMVNFKTLYRFLNKTFTFQRILAKPCSFTKVHIVVVICIRYETLIII